MKIILTVCVLFLAGHVMARAGAPTKSSTNLQFPVQRLDDDKLTLTFTKGNGTYRIVVIQEGFPVTEAPVNGVDYSANSVFGTRGTEFTAAEGYVVYRGKSAAANVTVTVTHLKPGATYYVSIFEFNGKGRVTEYLKTPLNGNQSTKSITVEAAQNTGKFAALNENGGPVNVVKHALAKFYSMENILVLASQQIISGVNRYMVTTKDTYTTLVNKHSNQYGQRLSI